MPSKSKAQQRFFGMVDAYKKGEMKNPSSKIKKAANGMSMSDVKDFAETKHKGLPEKVEENMEKKVIRMTESDLHQLVKESVNKILTELDWKTYASAGQKAGRSGSIDAQRELNPDGYPNQWLKDAVGARHRADKFYQQAKDQFNKDYGYKKGKRYDTDYSEAGFGGDFTSSEEFSPHAIGYRDKGYGNPYKYEYGRRYDGYAGKDMTPEEFYQGNEDAANAYRNADDEIKNWKKGKYNYEKDKGWQLKK